MAQISELKDPAIKLFGKTIKLPDIPAVTAATADCGGALPAAADGGYSEDPSSPEEDNSNGVGEDQEESDKDMCEDKLTEKEEERAQSMMSKEFTDPSACSVINDNPKTPSVDNESAAAKMSKTEEEQSETSDSQEKTLKKPDKILPCPRCNSMDTKFCYYNNYNVNQPRHFCKNCQRYWTAGGTMRNVPVGAGRRKNKTSAASHYRQITVSEAIHNGRVADATNGLHPQPILKANGTVLTFGSDTPLCESMASVLNIAEKTMVQNGFNKPEELGNRDEHSSGSSITNMSNCHGFSPQVPCFPGAPWPYPWNPQMGPTFCPPGFPMPFYPYWGCAVPGPWNVPWVAPPCTNTAPTSGSNSPTLGKHSREENVKSSECGEEEPQKENKPEKCLWIPKTLRIDDPGEAARSSIWATLGIKNDGSASVNGGGLFKAFQSKVEEKNHVSEPSAMLQANPAALSRSRNFQETS